MKIKTYLSCATLALGLLSALNTATAFNITTIDLTNRYAYGANIGWMDWVGGRTTAPSSALTSAPDTFSANVGWINLSGSPPTDPVSKQFGHRLRREQRRPGQFERLRLRREHRLDHVRADLRQAESESADRAVQRLRLERQLRLDFVEQRRRLCADGHHLARHSLPMACPLPGC